MGFFVSVAGGICREKSGKPLRDAVRTYTDVVLYMDVLKFDDSRSCVDIPNTCGGRELVAHDALNEVCERRKVTDYSLQCFPEAQYAITVEAIPLLLFAS